MQIENEKLTFENFIAGDANRFAYNAARAVADEPGQQYNPLFIYGESGAGKTHLLHAIAHAVHEKRPDLRILYIKSDEFLKEFIEAVRDPITTNFREKYYETDLLLADNIQFGIDAQNELLRILNWLIENKKQVVLTADRPPCEMEQINDRLRTKLEWGLLTEVHRII